MSAIDHALWEITGKVYGQPGYKPLGGAVRDRVRAFTHASDAKDARALLYDGFAAIKTPGWVGGANKVNEKEIPDALHAGSRRCEPK